MSSPFSPKNSSLLAAPPKTNTTNLPPPTLITTTIMSFPLEAVIESAVELGMDEENDKDLFFIAEEYLNCALPSPWQMLEHEDEEDGEVYPYYVNEDTGESIWEHPRLSEYKSKFEKEKKRRTERAKKDKEKSKSAKTAAKEEPKSPAKKASSAPKAKAKEEDDIVEEDFEEVSIEVPEVMAEDLYDDMKKPKKGNNDDDDRWGNAGGPPGERPTPDLSMPEGKKAIDSTASEDSR